MDEQGCTIQDLITLCATMGYKINQFTISKIRQGRSSMAITNLVFICKALSLDMNKVFALPGDEIEKQDDRVHYKKSIEPQVSSAFISDPGDPRLKPYFGDFWGYYYSAAKPENALETVRITIDKSSGYNKETSVTMTYRIPLDTQGETTQRIYKGTLVLSEKALTVYCNLRCEATGKQFNFSFLHTRNVYRKEGFKYAVCAVMCTNRGEVYVPTIQRMILSRQELSEYEMRRVRSQLKLNNKKILISKIHLRDVMKDERCRDLLMERICDGDMEWIDKLNYTGYYEFDESFFRGKFANEVDEATVINVLREYSQAVPYNKVGAKSSGFLKFGLKEAAIIQETKTPKL